MKLTNFFRKCICGKSVRFDNTEDLKECPKCKRILRIPTNMINYLLERKKNAKEEQLA